MALYEQKIEVTILVAAMNDDMAYEKTSIFCSDVLPNAILSELPHCEEYLGRGGIIVKTARPIIKGII